MTATKAKGSIKMDSIQKTAPEAPLPDWIEPTKATLSRDYFWDDNWSYEEKLDGERALAVKDASVTLYSRNRQVLNNTYPEIVDALDTIPGKWWLDGELVAYKGRITSFKQLQQRLGIKDPNEARKSPVRVYFCIFDLLYYNGRDVRQYPYRVRRDMLWQLVRPKDPIRLVKPLPARKESFTVACQRGWEGLMVKKLDSVYVSERTHDWLKFKCSNNQEFIIIGFTDPHGTRTRLGALLLGYYQNGQLHYAGKVGTGFTQSALGALYTQLAPLTTNIHLVPEHVPEKGVHFVTPKLVAEVGFSEWTDDNKLRHPRYLGLRNDKTPAEVIKEEPS